MRTSALSVVASAMTFCTVIIGALNPALAQPKLPEAHVEKLYRNALLARDIVSSLQSKVISNELKSTLLERSRVEDKAFAKAAVVHWKAYTDRNIHAEFDELVVTTDDGFEIMRMKMVPTSADTFLINGRNWTAPAKGSIEKSLRSHIAGSQASHKNKSSSIFASILSPQAAFALEPANEILPAYVYVMRGIEQTLSASSYLENKSPAPYIAIEGQTAQVNCTGSTAFGKAKLGTDEIQFESQNDGTLILTLADSKKLLVKSKIRNDGSYAAQNLERLDRLVASHSKSEAQVASSRAYYKSQLGQIINTEAVRVAECLDPKCETFKFGSHDDTLFPWIPRRTPASVERALKWRPKDPQSKAAITRDSVNGEDNSPYLKQNGANLTGMEIVSANTLIEAANIDIQNEKRYVKNFLFALRPLGACCASVPCRAQLASEKVNLEIQKTSGTKK